MLLYVAQTSLFSYAFVLTNKIANKNQELQVPSKPEFLRNLVHNIFNSSSLTRIISSLTFHPLVNKPSISFDCDQILLH